MAVTSPFFLHRGAGGPKGPRTLSRAHCGVRRSSLVLWSLHNYEKKLTCSRLKLIPTFDFTIPTLTSGLRLAFKRHPPSAPWTRLFRSNCRTASRTLLTDLAHLGPARSRSRVSCRERPLRRTTVPSLRDSPGAPRAPRARALSITKGRGSGAPGQGPSAAPRPARAT